MADMKRSLDDTRLQCNIHGSIPENLCITKVLQNLQKSFFTPKTLTHDQTYPSPHPSPGQNVHFKEWKNWHVRCTYNRVIPKQIGMFSILVLLFSFDVQRSGKE